MSDWFLGEIRLFGFNFAPRGWALCNGQLLSISSNSALFALIGTAYGGNGQTTFGLPNLQGRVAIHQGSGAGLSPYEMGQTGGTENVTLNSTQMPQHNHLINADQSNGAVVSPSGANLAQTVNNTGTRPVLYDTFTTGTPASPVQLVATTVTLAGGGQAHPNIQPYLTASYCIATVGVYPTRN